MQQGKIFNVDEAISSNDIKPKRDGFSDKVEDLQNPQKLKEFNLFKNQINEGSATTESTSKISKLVKSTRAET